VIKLRDHRNIVEDISELPEIKCENLYLDVETTSFNDREAAFDPYHGHKICGIAVTWDENLNSYYVPIRHRNERWNLPVENVVSWLRGIIARRWINHNLKFDAHFFLEDLGLDFTYLILEDTLNLAKLIDSDRFSHDLKDLGKEWIGLPMEEEEEVRRYLHEIRSKDYGAVPADILGKYACMDVIANRLLHRYLYEKKEESMNRVWEQEVFLTPVLFDMEREGIKVDIIKTQIESVKSLSIITQIEQRIKDRLGIHLVDSTKCMYDIFCVQLGLPVLARTEKTEKGGGDNPSFDAKTLKLYYALPEVINDPVSKEIVHLIQLWKTETTFESLFLNTLLKKNVNGVVHPKYKQSVRTGRMSCSDPNGQQFNYRAKGLIIPDEDEVLICGDASQMEFRVISHYCKIKSVIEKYIEDPKADYHAFIAEICEAERDPAKTLNFAIAFGAQKRRVTLELGNNKQIIDLVTKQIEQELSEGKLTVQNRAGRYKYLLQERGSNLYEKYHQEFPEVSYTSEKAKKICGRLGYIENKYGRRRHLSGRFKYKAFNALVQSCAMDIIKERMIAISPRYNPRMKGLKLLANVHDELLFSGPKGCEEMIPYIKETLEDVQVKFRVPFVWDMGSSDESWAKAKP
jgi:DNA polymerase-1